MSSTGGFVSDGGILSSWIFLFFLEFIWLFFYYYHILELLWSIANHVFKILILKGVHKDEDHFFLERKKLTWMTIPRHLWTYSLTISLAIFSILWKIIRSYTNSRFSWYFLIKASTK
jgi:hypothetical protein